MNDGRDLSRSKCRPERELPAGADADAAAGVTQSPEEAKSDQIKRPTTVLCEQKANNKNTEKK
jgi:hypothetical protein